MKKRENPIFCTYARYRGLWWLYGWFLVGIGNEPHLNGLSNEYYTQDCKLILIEFNDPDPAPINFWLLPRRGIIRFWCRG